MPRVYFAAPLFCAAEKDYNSEITSLLEGADYDVFLPQRDGVLAAELENKTEAQMVNTVFKRDVVEINKCDILFMVLDGRVPDEGACVELGIAYALQKRCYGLRSDVRALEKGLSVNPLLAGCFVKIFQNPDKECLLKELKEFLAENKL